MEPYSYVGNNPINFTDPTGMSKEGSDGWIEQQSNGKTTLTHIPEIKTVQQAQEAGFDNVTDVHNDDAFTIGEPKSYIFNGNGAVNGLDLYSSNQHGGMYYGHTEGGTEVRTYNFTSPGIRPQSGHITSIGGIGDVFGFKEMAFGEVSTATGNPYIAIALGAIGGKFSASSAIKSGSRSFDKITDSYLKKLGIDAHQLKRSFLGEKAPIARYDLYKGPGGEVLILQKGGRGVPIQTGEFIK